MDLSLSYQASGTGGTQFAYGTGFPPPIVSRTDRSLGSALGDTFSGAYPTWSVGVSVAYPLGRSAEEASYASAQVQKRQQELSLRQLELQVVREVREATRQVQNTWERVQATRTARTASEQQLEAEERRFAVGFSTTLELQIRQRDLASARINELNAMIDLQQGAHYARTGPKDAVGSGFTVHGCKVRVHGSGSRFGFEVPVRGSEP